MKKINELYETHTRTIDVPNPDGVTVDKRQEEYLMPVMLNLAGSSTRFAHYIIDFIVLMVIQVIGLSVLFAGTKNTALSYGFAYVCSFLYYSILESTAGQSIGKIITGCVVVDEYGQKISLQKAMGRSLCRMVPFEALSFFGDGRGWHDQWSNTYVMHKRELALLLDKAGSDQNHIVDSLITD